MAIPTGNTKWCLTQTADNGAQGANNREPYDLRLEETGFDHGEEVKQSDLNDWMFNVGEKLEYVMGEITDGGSETGSDILIEITNAMTWTAIQEKIDAEVPRVIPWRIQVVIELENGAYLVTSGKHFRIPSYSGGGLLIVKAKNTVDATTDNKNVTITGDGGPMFNEFEPYSDGGQSKQRYLVAAANVPYVLLGDIFFDLNANSLTTYNTSAVIGVMDSVVSTNHCYVKNRRTDDAFSMGIYGFNRSYIVSILNKIEVPLSMTSGISACVAASFGARFSSGNDRGEGFYAYYARESFGTARSTSISFTGAQKLEDLGDIRIA